jgi:hypothetical protein
MANTPSERIAVGGAAVAVIIIFIIYSLILSA